MRALVRFPGCQSGNFEVARKLSEGSYEGALADERSVDLTDPVDPVEHWVQMTDSWVKRVDQGMGATADAAKTEQEPPEELAEG